MDQHHLEENLVYRGGNSEFFPTPVSYPSTKRVRAVGGGGGMGYPSSPVSTMNGGSGGGATCSPTPYAGGTGNTTDPNHPQVQGYAGGDGTPSYQGPYAGGGGGGAGRVGAPDNPSTPLTRSTGGYGLQCLIAGSPANPQPIGAPGPGSGAAATGYFSGGGGGGSYGVGGAAGGYGGGADGGGTNIPSNNGPHAAASTGGGGGGSGYVSAYGHGGNGGSGVVVVRYKISELTGTAKASGGSISFYGSKTIHAFTSSGNFVAPATFNETVEYVVVGGGGAGGGPSAPSVDSYYGGGGGAGTYRKGSTPISTPQTIAIQVGAGGAKGTLLPAGGSPSYFGSPITSPGGGFGATWQDSAGGNRNGGPGGSSGGANYGGPGSTEPSTGDNFSPTDATANTPTNGWGHPGGTGAPQGNSGGGGGAGGSGQNADATNGGDGGAGMQLPTTFRDPAQSFGAPGPTNTSTHNPGWTNIDNSGKYWVAGGGGGSSYGPNDAYTPGGGGTNTHGPGSYAGAGQGSRFFANGTAALQNTGSGGGGMERMGPGPSPQPDAGNGGSGLVLIAYPT